MKLDEVIAQLGAEEREVLQLVGLRLLEGQRQYGRLDLAHDERDFRLELHEELLDAAVYRVLVHMAAARRAGEASR